MKKISILLLVALLAFFATSFNPTVDAVDNVIEESIEVEDWMTKPLMDSLEEPIVLEDWMTKPFNIKS